MWWSIYEQLDLRGGECIYESDDSDDMLEIRYPDTMLIDVGYSSDDCCYYITVVASNDLKGWQQPLLITTVQDKADLFNKIQSIIYKYRSE